MRGLRKITAMLTGKILLLLMKVLGRQGTVLPGKIARRIDPDILKKLAKNITEEIIVVTGTNGKTTTSNMIAQILTEEGYSIIHNRAGANMLTGITTAFIAGSDFTGRRRYHYAVLETDEANVPLLLREVKPRLLLITNFFRDQLDRYGELDYTVKMIKDAVRESSIELVLNADDPLMADFERYTGLCVWYYGFDDTDYDTLVSSESREGRYCVFCGNEISYRRYHYAQLGSFYCNKCGNHNPEPNFLARDLVMNPHLRFKINNIEIESYYQGFYNAYNILAAVSAAKLLGVENETIRKAIKSYIPRAGRMEVFNINGKETILILVKNPAGLNQTLTAMKHDKRRKNIFLALNDNAADGRDVSWIWDADVEIINETNYERIVCSGKRSGDIAVRIKYSGVSENTILIKTPLKEGIEAACSGEGETTYILSTYTALFPCRKILRRMHHKKASKEGEVFRLTE
ncbi:Mur ligase family protein [Thermosyntropha sp.]|uniref:Mur ligase family protein n=1 Tax=Thermosyntropha sp. TaxID=2740820 RepID=UPI0025D9E9C2|nr:Mur ligase family protein [Thermosyntropha sp.]MBO8158565.1 Mur ligase family protein [Thermosyntropha sp.]